MIWEKSEVNSAILAIPKHKMVAYQIEGDSTPRESYGDADTARLELGPISRIIPIF